VFEGEARRRFRKSVRENTDLLTRRVDAEQKYEAPPPRPYFFFKYKNKQKQTKTIKKHIIFTNELRQGLDYGPIDNELQQSYERSLSRRDLGSSLPLA
jgi:hypothetical protein